jgi:hypothetical protein
MRHHVAHGRDRFCNRGARGARFKLLTDVQFRDERDNYKKGLI